MSARTIVRRVGRGEHHRAQARWVANRVRLRSSVPYESPYRVIARGRAPCGRPRYRRGFAEVNPDTEARAGSRSRRPRPPPHHPLCSCGQSTACECPVPRWSISTRSRRRNSDPKTALYDFAESKLVLAYPGPPSTATMVPTGGFAARSRGRTAKKIDWSPRLGSARTAAR